MRPELVLGRPVTSREKRALVLLGIAVVLAVLLKLVTSSGPAPAVAAAVDSVPQAEKRLARLRQEAATVPGRQAVLKSVADELAVREKSMVVADTAQQAQAHIQQIVHAVGGAQGIEVRGAEFGQVKPFGSDYGEAPVAVQFECNVEQLVNFLAALGAQPEMFGTSEIRITAINPGNPKDKRISVRLIVSGVVGKKLVPEKKGSSLF